MSEKLKEIIIALVIIVILFLIIPGSGGSSSSGRKWSDLNEQEKDNARWAYYAQQAIDERN